MRRLLICAACLSFAAFTSVSQAQISVSLPILEDTTLINTGAGDFNRAELIIGNAGGTAGRTSLLRFDLASLVIPSGKQVASVSAATLDLTVPQNRVDAGIQTAATVNVSAISIGAGDWIIDEANWSDRFQDDVETNNAGDPRRHRWANVGALSLTPSTHSEIGPDGIVGPTEAGPDGLIGTEDDNTADDNDGFDGAGNTYANAPDLLGIIGQGSTDTAGTDFSIDLAAAPEVGADLATVLNNWQVTNSGLHLSAPDATGQVFLGSQQSDQVDAASAVLNLTFTLEDIPTGALGDFDLDGTVDVDDLDEYIGNIGAAAAGELAALDLDDNGTVDAGDFATHYSTLVETSSGIDGTFQGDANLDGAVDVLNDAAALINNLGENSNTSWSRGDFNADGVVDVLNDAAALINNLGSSNFVTAAPATSAVPEPGSLSLLALAGLSTIARRRR